MSGEIAIEKNFPRFIKNLLTFETQRTILSVDTEMLHTRNHQKGKD